MQHTFDPEIKTSQKMNTALKYENGQFIKVTGNEKVSKSTENAGGFFSKMIHEKKWNSRLGILADLMNTIISLVVAIQITWLMINY
jgi:hypothetical protein